VATSDPSIRLNDAYGKMASELVRPALGVWVTLILIKEIVALADHI
jgi:hypothetical protein